MPITAFATERIHCAKTDSSFPIVADLVRVDRAVQVSDIGGVEIHGDTTDGRRSPFLVGNVLKGSECESRIQISDDAGKKKAGGIAKRAIVSSGEPASGLPLLWTEFPEVVQLKYEGPFSQAE
jgi:hypothetical protein